MRIKELGSRPAPATIRDLWSRVVRGRGPVVSVQRRQIPYWEERGWTRKGNTYTGNYQTSLRRLLGTNRAAPERPYRFSAVSTLR